MEMEDDLGFDFDVDDKTIEKMQNRFYVDLTKFTDSHLTNRLKYFERMLADDPGEQYYMGDSDAAEDAVECENIHNEILAEEITEHIEDLKKEINNRLGGNENE